MESAGASATGAGAASPAAEDTATRSGGPAAASTAGHTAAPPAAALGPQALAGLKVVEMGQLIAGPFAAKTLADFGAEVLKIEPPKAGDPLRGWRLLQDGTSVWWQVQSRNKRSIALDLRRPEGQALARQLIARADVLVENFRPGTLEGWGMGYDELARDNPGLRALPRPAGLWRHRRGNGRAAPPDR